MGVYGDGVKCDKEVLRRVQSRVLDEIFNASRRMLASLLSGALRVGAENRKMLLGCALKIN